MTSLTRYCKPRALPADDPCPLAMNVPSDEPGWQLLPLEENFDL